MEMDKNLVREVIAKRVAQEFHDGYVVNLGIGLPTLVANYVGDMDVIFQSENGCIGVGPAPEKGKEDPHAWLNLETDIIYAKNIAKRLNRKRP